MFWGQFGAVVVFTAAKLSTKTEILHHAKIPRYYTVWPNYCCPSSSMHAGLTPAHVATKEASIDVLKFLFQMGANKNAPVSLMPCTCGQKMK